MRTAHYKILCTHDVRSGKWSGYGRVVDTCKSLARDGFNYQVQVRFFDPDAERALVTIRGKAGAAKLKPRHKSRPSLAPPVPTAEQCAKRRAEAETHLQHIREGAKRRMDRQAVPYRYTAPYDHAERIKQRAVGRAIAQIIARHNTAICCGRNHTDFTPSKPDYELMDRAVGCRVERESELRTRDRERGWVASIVSRYARGWFGRTKNAPEPKEPDPTIAQNWNAARADVEYWREMEALSGQRDHWKPGLTDETMYQDDEAPA